MNNEKLEKLLKKIDSMSTEEYESQFLCLNGTMTEETFDEVVEYIDENDLIVSDVAYRNNQLYEKFVDVFHYIDTIAEDYKVPAESEWYEDFIYFSYKEKNYVWRVVMGQGSYCGIYTDIVNDRDRCEIKIDPTIKFFKRIDKC